MLGVHPSRVGSLHLELEAKEMARNVAVAMAAAEKELWVAARLGTSAPHTCLHICVYIYIYRDAYIYVMCVYMQIFDVIKVILHDIPERLNP